MTTGDHSKILLLIIALASLLRVWQLGAPFVGDEGDWFTLTTTYSTTGSMEHPRIAYLKYGANETQGYGPNEPWTLHPPLALFIYAFSYSALPFSAEVSMRCVPLFFGLLTVVLTYLLGRMMFNETVGLTSAFLLAISPYHIFHSSFTVDIDGGLLTFLFLLAVIVYLHWNRTQKSVFIWFCGLIIGLCILSRLSAVALLLFLVLCELLNRRVRSSAVLVGGAFMVFLSWVMYDLYQANLIHIVGVIRHTIPSFGAGALMYNLIYGWVMIAQQLTPPVLALLLCAFGFILKNNLSAVSSLKIRELISQSEVLLAAIVLFVLAVYTLPASGDVQRYFSIALPFLFIVIAKFLSEFRFLLKAVVFTAILWFSLLTLFRINDYMFYSLMLSRTGLASIVLWGIPLLTLLPLMLGYGRRLVVSLLFGWLLAYAFYYSVFTDVNWPLSISTTLDGVRSLDAPYLVVSKSSYMLKSVMYYDFLDHGRLTNSYLYLTKFEDIALFMEKNPGCDTVYMGRYPLLMKCRNLNYI